MRGSYRIDQNVWRRPSYQTTINLYCIFMVNLIHVFLYKNTAYKYKKYIPAKYNSKQVHQPSGTKDYLILHINHAFDLVCIFVVELFKQILYTHEINSISDDLSYRIELIQGINPNVKCPSNQNKLLLQSIYSL